MPTFIGVVSTPGDTGSNNNRQATVDPSGLSLQQGDLLYAFMGQDNSAGTLSISNGGGQTWDSGVNLTGVSQASRGFWATFNGTWAANPVFLSSGGTTASPVTVVLVAFRPDGGTGSTWAVDVAYDATTHGNPSPPYDIVRAGVTTLTNNAVVIASWLCADSFSYALQTAGWTNPGGITQVRNTAGDDNAVSIAYKIQAVAGPTGSVTNRLSAVAKGHTGIVAFKEIAGGGPPPVGAPEDDGVVGGHEIGALAVASDSTLEQAPPAPTVTGEVGGHYIGAVEIGGPATGPTVAPPDVETSTSPKFKIASLQTPSTDTNHVFVYSYSKDVAGGERVDFKARLYQGTTLVVERSHTGINETVQSSSYALSAAEMAAVTNYADVYVEFEFAFHQDGDHRIGRVYWTRFDIPDAIAAGAITPDDVFLPVTVESPTVVAGAPPPTDTDKVFINGVEVPIYETPALEIVDRIEEPSTATFCVYDAEGALRFQRSQRVIILDENGRRVFAGYITNVEETRINQFGARKHKIQCTDNHYKAAKRRVVQSYEDMAVEDILQDLVEKYLEPEGVLFSTALIDPGPIIGEAVFAYRPLTEVLDKLATLANAWWRIDHDDVFHFRDRASEVASWTLTGLDIIGDPHYTRSAPLYRNRQYIRGPRDLTDPQTFGPKAGDGVAREWTMGFPLAKVPTVLVNGVEAVVDLKMRAGDHTADFYWQKGDPVIVQDSNAAALTGSNTIQVTYQGEFNIIVFAEDLGAQAAQAAIEGGGTGIVEAVDDDASIGTRVAGLQKAGALLAKYGVDGEALAFETLRAGLSPGEVQTVNLPAHALDNDGMLITEIATSRMRSPEGATGFIYRRRVTAIIGPNTGGWQKFFQRLASPPSFIEAVSVGEETSLTILHTESEEIGIEEEVTFTVTACNYPGTDQYPALDRWPC